MNMNIKEQKTTKQLSYKTLRVFMRDPNIKPLEKCVLIDLLLYAGIGGQAFPSEMLLGKDFGVSDRHIRTQLKNLQKKGWILNWKRRGYSNSNLYELNAELYFRNDTQDRNSASAQSETTVPIQNGSVVPPNVDQERMQLSSSKVLQLFEKTSNTKCTPTDHRRLQELCEKHSAPLIEDAIKEIATRKYPIVRVGLISKILNDWEKDGKPTQKPEFSPCGKDGCENGYKFSLNIASPCQCKLDDERTNYEKVTK